MATQQRQIDFQYADALAAELLRHLGFEAAQRTCRENHWDGVLDALARRQSGSSSNG